jgi:hypothetical protein
LVHRLTGGIPRLVNLVCDRALLAAYAARTNRVSPEMVQQAAENLELSNGQPSRFGWLRRRASVVVTAVGATASLAVVGGVVVPDLRAAAAKAAAAPVPPGAPDESKPATPIAQAVAPKAPPPAEPPAPAKPPQQPRHAVLVSSFPIASLARVGSIANVKLEEVVGQLQGMGYSPRFRDVDLGENGEWRGVLVGEFATVEEAQAEADRLHQRPEFADAKASRY